MFINGKEKEARHIVCQASCMLSYPNRDNVRFQITPSLIDNNIIYNSLKFQASARQTIEYYISGAAFVDA